MEKKSSPPDLAPPGMQWVVVHTRPRCEKKVADYCKRCAMPSYLPLRSRTHQYGARQRVFASPVFPGYAFCMVRANERSKLAQNRYVANLLDVLDQKRLVAQLCQIHRALEVGDVSEVMPYIEAGKMVRVKGGPLNGLEGMVMSKKGHTRVVINVDMIRQAVAVEVDSSFLVPA